MLRRVNTRPLHWADKTMSVLRADQLEACEKDLTGLPGCCLFDSGCGDSDAETLYDMSWYAPEDKAKSVFPSLHTVQELRTRVLSCFSAELSLLSPEEHDLMIRLVLFGGHSALQDWNELIPALSLIRRLWCRGTWKEGTLILHMPHQLCSMSLLLLASDEHRKIRDIIEKVIENVDNTLYLMGIMQASAPLLHLQSLLKGTSAENHMELSTRLLCSAFDYTFDHDGRLILIHPGLADPDRMIRCLSDIVQSGSVNQITGELLGNASSTVMDLESPLYEQMLSSLNGAVRPELTAEDAVEDLIILAKQGVSLSDMKEVLSSMLVSFPTDEMLVSLSRISGQVPRWLSFSSSQVQ